MSNDMLRRLRDSRMASGGKATKLFAARSRTWHQAHRKELADNIRDAARAICAKARADLKGAATASSVRLVPINTGAHVPQGVSFRDWRQTLKANRIQHKRTGRK